MLPLHGVWVQSLVEELRSCMLCGAFKNTTKKNGNVSTCFGAGGLSTPGRTLPCLYQPLVPAGSPWCSLTCSCFIPRFCLYLHMVIFLCVSPLLVSRLPSLETHWILEKIEKVKSLSCVQLFVTPWTIAYKGPPSMEFSRQEYWSGLPFPSPGDLPNPGIEPRSPALQADSLPSEPPGKPLSCMTHPFIIRPHFWLGPPFK